MTTIAEQRVEPGVSAHSLRPEILAPAGNEEMMKAAVENGADAVYFGLHHFNARMKAKNFDADDLPRIMKWLHERGVKGYVTLNTLIFPSELGEAADALRVCSAAGVDAVLVQDLGIASLANRMVPGLPLHASTQMTVSCSEGVEGLRQLGLKLDRIVAARELSRKELNKMRKDAAVEIEVFVHGALCVAYSGQCLTSEALGGRSANRGECAQACRLPYDLIVDGEKRDLEDVRYLLSPRDLSAYKDIKDLKDLGIVSLKIEGRYKSPEYVAATVQSYRKSVDEAMRDVEPTLDEGTRQKLEMTFSRGFTGGYLHDINHQAVVEGRFPKKRGLYLGKVIEVLRDGVVVHLEGPVKCGDGIVFDAGNPDADEEGGRVYELDQRGKAIKSFDPEGDANKFCDVTLRFGRDRINLRRVAPGQLMWKTSDPKLDAELKASFDGDQIRFRRPIRAVVEGRPGGFLRASFWDWDGHRVDVEDTVPADAARNRPLNREVLIDQLGRLGGTPFFMEELDNRLEGDVMVPVSRLNDMRRRAVEKLLEVRRNIGLGRPEFMEELGEMRRAVCGVDWNLAPPFAPSSTSKLAVLCRSLEQVEAAAAHPGVDTIYTEFEDVRVHTRARALVPRNGPRFVPAGLRIVKPGETGFIKTLLNSEPDAILVRNLASWVILQQEAPALPVIGDFALNVANQLTAKLLVDHGIKLLTPSYDLNFEQLSDLLRAAPPEWFEVTIHQYMPMFHMEHCVFCRFLSDGTDYTNCGRPCDTHHIALRDRVGFDHVVKADAGCRNTVFNGAAQSGSEYVEAMLALGVRRFRVDFLTEDAGRVKETIDAYLPVIRGEASGKDLWRRLKATAKLGVTKGSLDK